MIEQVLTILSVFYRFLSTLKNGFNRVERSCDDYKDSSHFEV